MSGKLPFDPEDMLAKLASKMVSEAGAKGSVPAAKVARELIREFMMRDVPTDHERRMSTEDSVELARYLGSLGENDKEIAEEVGRRFGRKPGPQERVAAAEGRRETRRLVRRLQIEAFQNGTEFKTTSWMRGD